jgi:hypothetical protein
MQDFLTWIDARTFGEWVAFISLIVALIVGFITKDKLFKKTIKAEKGSVALGDNAKGNTITVHSTVSKDKEDAR